MATRLLSEKAGVAASIDRSPDAAGMVQAFSGVTAPSGWLFCDGAEYSQTLYPDLFARISTTYATQINTTTGSVFTAPSAGNFRVPDYRGVFLRGVGTALSQSAVSLGGFQADQNVSHNHGGLARVVRNNAGNPTLGTYANGGGPGYETFTQTGTTVLNGGDWEAVITADGGTESRPRNKGVNYIIRAWDAQSTSISSSSSSGGLTALGLTTSITAATNIMYLVDVTSGPITLTLPSGITAATVGVLDSLEIFSTSNYLNIVPASGQSISTYAVDDILQLRTPRSQLVLYRAAGTSTWKIQAQASTNTPIATATTQGTVSGGLVPAKVPATVTDTIGSSYVGQFIDLSSTVAVNYGNTTALNNIWAEVNGITLLPGVYEVVAHVLWSRNGATFSSVSDVLVGFSVPPGGTDPYTQNGWWQGTNGTGISTAASTFGQSLSVLAVSDGTNISINGRTSTAGTSIRLKTFLGTYTAGQPVFKYIFYAKRIG